MGASSKPRSRRRIAFDTLENRRLLSGSWTTVDSLAPVGTASGIVYSMASDAAGNVYAAGENGGAGLIRQKSAGVSAFVTIPTNVTNTFYSVAADARGDVFVSGGTVILERPAGQSAFAPVNVVVPAGVRWELNGDQSFAANAAGDVYAVGSVSVPSTTTARGKTTTTYTRYGALFAMKAGQASFSVVYQSTSFYPEAITLIDVGASAGLYVTNYAAGWTGWNIRKSVDGGASWSTVDNFTYDAYTTDLTQANAIASDSSGNGNVYVVGYGFQRVITGYNYTKVKGQLQQVPVYDYHKHWVTRRSSDGGATWSVVDDFQQSQTIENEPFSVADLDGTVYVAGGDSAVVRSNVGGAWQTVDNFASSYFSAVTIDSNTGTPYVGGEGAAGGWFVRSGPAPAAVQSTFSSISILGVSPTVDRELVEELFGTTV